MRKRHEIIADINALQTELRSSGITTDRLGEIEARLSELSAELTAIDEAEEKRQRLLSSIASGASGDQVEGFPGGGLAGASEGRGIQTSARDFEYRRAFMDHVLTGTPIAMRASTTTTTADASAAIPTSLAQRIISEAKAVGRIYAAVTKTNIPGGVDYPVSSVRPTATWVGEKVVTDKQKMNVTGKISFGYHKLQCRVAITLTASVTTLEEFEALMVAQSVEAMVTAIEKAVLVGSGSGAPKGITKETIPDKRIIMMDAAKISKFTEWTKVLAAVPQSYRNGATLIMTQLDYDTYIDGMTDTNGQPVARTNFGLDGQPVEKFRWCPVTAIEDHLPSFEDASDGDIIGVVCKLKDYAINSNLEMFYKKYFDEETDDWVHKLTLIADGKMLDPNGLVFIKASKPAG